MIIVHHLENSRSQRILWLLEELGQPYDIVAYRRGADRTAPASLKGVEHIGKSPVIQDGELTLAESGAIVEYLIERCGPAGLAPPPGSAMRPAYLHWMHFAEGTLGGLNNARVWLKRVGPPSEPVVERIEGQIHAALDVVEETLRDRPWLAGDFSAADVMISFPLQAARDRGMLTDDHARIRPYLERLEARPAYLRSIARGGPFASPV
jgi:glutathione S-transferase